MKVWALFGLNGLLKKNGDIIIPVSNKGPLYIIKATYKNEAVWKYDEEVEE